MLTKINPQILGERRLARIEIEAEQLFEWMQIDAEHRFKTVKGLPKGAVFIASFHDPARLTISFIFYHPAFQIINIGSEIPQIPWTVTDAY